MLLHPCKYRRPGFRRELARGTPGRCVFHYSKFVLVALVTVTKPKINNGGPTHCSLSRAAQSWRLLPSSRREASVGLHPKRKRISAPFPIFKVVPVSKPKRYKVDYFFRTPPPLQGKLSQEKHKQLQSPCCDAGNAKRTVGQRELPEVTLYSPRPNGRSCTDQSTHGAAPENRWARKGRKPPANNLEPVRSARR